LLAIINLAAYPLAVNAIEGEGIEAAKGVMAETLVLILALICPATAGLCILAPNICHVLLGAEFRETAARLIPWVAVGTMFAGIKAFYFDLSFQLGRRTTGQVGVVSCAALVNLLLNLWWIPEFGLIGSAYATAVAYAVAMLLSWRIGRSIMRLPFPLPSTAKILIATAGMGLVISSLGHLRGTPELAVQIVLGIAVFGALIWAMDLERLRSGQSRLGAKRRLILDEGKVPEP
jgi:O-antigen/teichoic acid export membrane protein